MTEEQPSFKRVEQESFTMKPTTHPPWQGGGWGEPRTHGSTVTVSRLTWHRFPEKPARQRHWKLSTSSWQRPPFRHGELEHSSMSFSQCSPEKPGGQMHRYPLTRS